MAEEGAVLLKNRRRALPLTHRDLRRGVAGRRVSLGVSSRYYLLKTSILNPDGTVLAGPGYTGAGTSFVDAATLKQTGTYTVVADPQDVGTGSVSYTLYDVPPDPAATTSVAAPPVTLTTTVPGQNGSVTFQGAAGQSVSVSYSTSGMAATSGIAAVLTA